MSNTVDNRVVEMQFKNEDFERGVKQTITSLDGLKKALEINTNSLDLSRVQREADKLNLERVTSSIEALTDRFSTLGIVGMATIQRLTNGAINLVEKIGSASIGQILTGGKGRAQKVADARFKLEGLMRDYEDSAKRIEDVFGSASEAVNDTAFGLDEAVNISAMLVGSGVDYEKMADGVSDLDTALMGIAGAAAMSNSSFEEIGRIFAQVKTAGRLMGQDMMQLQGRTINVTAEIAKYLNLTQAEVQEMVHKGEIDFNTFAAAMNNSFGAQAKKSNETLQGVLSNVRSALSRIGEIFYSGIIENKDLIAFFGDLKSRINDFKKSLEPLKEPFANLISSFSKLGSAILGTINIGGAQGWNGFINLIAKTFEKISSIIDTITSKIGGFAEDMHLNEAAEEVKETVEKIDESVQKVKEIANTIWFGDESGRNPYGNGQTRVEALGDMYDQVQAYVNAMKEADFDMEKADQIYAQNAVETTNTVTDAKQREMEARLGLNRVTDQSVENAEKTSAAFSPLLTVLGNIMKGVAAIGRAFKKVFSVKDLKASIGQLTSSFGKVVSAIGITEERASNLESFFTGLFSIFKMVGDTLVNLISGGFEVLAKVLPTIIDGISRFIGFIGNAINSFREFVESNNLLVRAGRFVATTFTKVTSTLKEFFSKFIELPAVQKLKEEFIDIYDRVGAQLIKWFGDAQSALGDFFGVFDDADDTTMNKILGSINDALETMMSLAGDAKGHISDFFARFKAGGDLENTAIYLENVNKGYTTLKRTTDSLAHSGSIGEFVSNMSTAFGVGSSDGILAKGEGVLKKLANGFKNIDLAKLTLIGLSGSLVAASVSFSVFTYKISDAVQAFAELPRQLTGVFQSMRGALMGVQQYFKRKGDAKMITQLAIAIGLLFASIAALAVIGHKYDLTKPMIAMSLVVGLLTVMIGVISSLSNKIEDADKFNKTMEAFAKALLSVGASIFLVAAAMSVMTEIDWDKDAWISLGVLVGLMAALIGVVAVINKLGPEIKSSGLWLIFYAGSVYLLVRALNLLNKMDITGIGKKLGVLAGAMLLVAMVAAASSKMSFGSGLGIIAIVSSIVALEIALKWLLKFGVDKDDIEKNVSALVIAILSLGAIAGYMIVVGNMIHNPTGVAATILSAVVAVIAVSRALKKVSQIPSEKLGGATIALTVLMGTIGGLIYVIGTFGQGNRIKQAGTAILKIALALGALSLVVAFLGYLDKDTLKQGGEAVAQLTALMVAIILATKFSGSANPKAFLAMIAVMATLALLVSLMSFIEDKEALTKAAIIFGGVLLAFALSMLMACKYARKVTVQPLMQMVSLVTMIGLMLLGLTWISKDNFAPLIAAAGAMGGVLIALGICAKIMMTSFTKQGIGPAKMKEVAKAIGMMAIVVGAIGLVLTLISGVAKGNWATLLAAGASIVGVLYIMAKMLQIINEKIPGGTAIVKELNNKLTCLKWLLIAMAVIGGSIALIAYAGQGNWATVGMAAAGLLVLIAALTAVYFALSKIPGNATTMTGKAYALVLMSLALLPAAQALSLLGNYDWHNILGMAGSLAAVIITLTIALGVLTAIAKSGGAGVMFGVAAAFGVLSILLAASIRIIAKSIDIVVESIGKLAKIDYDQINIEKLGELVKLLLQLSLTSIVTSIGISAISAALVLLGGALAIVGIGVSAILLTGAAFIKEVNKLFMTLERITLISNQVSTGIKVITAALVSSIKDIAVGMAMGFALFVQTLSLKAVIIGTAIKNFLLTVIDIISEIKVDVERKIIEGLTDLFTMLEETLPELFRHFNGVVLACLAEVAASAQMYGYFGAIIASEFAIGLMAGLAEKSNDLVDTAVWLTMSVIKAVRDTFDNYKDVIGSKFEEWLSEGSSKFYKFIGYTYGATNPVLGYEALKLSDEMKTNAQAAHRSFDDEWKALSEKNAERNTKKFFGDQEQEIQNYDTTNIKNTTAAKQSDILDQSETSGKAAEDTMNEYLNKLDQYDFNSKGPVKDKVLDYIKTSLIGSTTQAFEESEGILASEVEKWDDKAIDALKADGYRLNDAGTEWVKPITKGATDAIEGKEGDDALSSISDFLGLSGNGSDGIGGLLNGFSAEMSDSADESGGNFIDGLVNKLSSDESLSMLGDAAGMDADAITKSFNENLEIESPSKVAMRSMGYWIDGLLIPMNSDFNNKRLSDAAVKNANSIMGSFNNQISDASTIFTPTIRPVLDTNNMGQYRGFMDILNNPTTVQLAADSQLAIKDNNQMQLANQVAALQASVDKLANTDFSHMMDGVNINVNADTTVDGTVLRKTASNYTIRQINKEEMGYMMATGGRY